MELLLKDSGVFIYLLSVIVIISYTSFTKVQRLSIIYIFTYGLAFTQTFPVWMTVVLLLAVVFIYEEYLTDDSMKICILYKWSYKIADAIFMAVFQYKIIWIIAGILLRADALEQILCTYGGDVFWQYAEVPIKALSVLCVFVGIHSMYAEKEVYYTFDEMYRKIQQYPYYSIHFSEALRERLSLVADMEDSSYFQRKKSYSFASVEFIRIWRAKKVGKNDGIRRHRNFWLLFSIVKLRIKEAGWKRAFQKGIHLMKRCINDFFYLCREKIRWFVGLLTRGHSTIEMQLIRILSYKEGLLLGRPNGTEEWIRTIKRKCYECLYAKMFFDGLKCYLSKCLRRELPDYRSFLVVLYLHTVQSKVGSETYRPLDKMYNDSEIEKWPMELLFLTCLGLNSQPITGLRVWIRWSIIRKYGLNEEKLMQMVEQLSS